MTKYSLLVLGCAWILWSQSLPMRCSELGGGGMCTGMMLFTERQGLKYEEAYDTRQACEDARVAKQTEWHVQNGERVVGGPDTSGYTTVIHITLWCLPVGIDPVATGKF